MDNKNALQMIGHRMKGVQAMVLTEEDFVKLDSMNQGLLGHNNITQKQADSEIARLKAAEKDVLSRMSKEDVKEYEASVVADKDARAARKDAEFGVLLKKKGK